jgi:hypothetical protein
MRSAMQPEPAVIAWSWKVSDQKLYVTSGTLQVAADWTQLSDREPAGPPLRERTGHFCNKTDVTLAF